MTETLHVVRYTNRKMYAEGSYLTFDALLKHAVGQRPISVTTHDTKEDVTAWAMARVLYRMARKNGVPADWMRQLVQKANRGNAIKAAAQSAKGL